MPLSLTISFISCQRSNFQCGYCRKELNENAKDSQLQGIGNFRDNPKALQIWLMRRPSVLALLLVKPAWGTGGGILTLLAVFGERIFRGW